jgi:Protein of unknown function (DUF998)
VSEAGTGGQPFALAYRTGLLILALGVALLGVCFRAGGRLVGTLLLVASGLAAVSGAVSCSGGCPLPPYEPATTADVVHAGASIVGMATLAAAMVATWWLAVDRALRQLSLGAAALTIPLGGAIGLIMLFVGRSQLGATLERLLLVVAVTWLAGTSGLTYLRNCVKLELWTSRNVSRRWSVSSRS